MRPIKTGVIGIGHLGKIHARIYHELEESQLVGVVDIDPQKASYAEAYGVPFFTNHTDLLGKVEAVSIATPTSTHYAIARDFLKHGVHVLIEKPIALQLDHADELLALAKQAHLTLQVGHIERHNPGLKRVAEIANQIRFFEIHRLGPFTGRIQDCGVVLDLMIHDIDIVMSLIRSPVQSFDAVGIPVLTPYEDIANVRIRFKNGAVADLTASRLTPERQRKIRIFQQDAYISLDYEAQSCKIFRKKDGHILQESLPIQKAEPLKEEIRSFLESVENQEASIDWRAREALAFALEIVKAIESQSKALSPSSSQQ